MPHVSRIHLDKKTEQQLIHTLDRILSKIEKEKEMEDFLLSLLTPTERLMLAKRLAIVILLKEGVSETHIAETLHVTRVTVSRLQLFLEARGKGFEIAFVILKREKILKDVRKALLSLVRYSVRAAGGYVKPTIFD